MVEMKVPNSTNKQSGPFQHQQQASQRPPQHGSPLLLQSRPHSSQSQRRLAGSGTSHEMNGYGSTSQQQLTHDNFAGMTQGEQLDSSAPTTSIHAAAAHVSTGNALHRRTYRLAQSYSPESNYYAPSAAASSGSKPQLGSHVSAGGSASHPQNSAANYFNSNPTTDFRSPPLPYSYSNYQNHASGPAVDAATMSLSYESRGFMQDAANYPQMEPVDDYKDHHRYPSPPRMGDTSGLTNDPYAPQDISGPAGQQIVLDLPSLQHKDDSEPESPDRGKTMPKPIREETKDDKGRFFCAWPGCTEEIKEFNRKCEWSKHMDKHDRPYRCLEIGCEKLPGFTYSGGLLRHEREVHNKHGGPRKQLNCPHPNCKRNAGKGFSRLENLNEHLRRVHTNIGFVAPPDDVSVTQQLGLDDVNLGGQKAGTKRKRMSNAGLLGGSDGDLREELKRLRAENEDLRRQAEQQHAHTAEMMRQLQALQHSLSVSMPPRLQAPQAPMM